MGTPGIQARSASKGMQVAGTSRAERVSFKSRSVIAFARCRRSNDLTRQSVEPALWPTLADSVTMLEARGIQSALIRRSRICSS